MDTKYYVDDRTIATLAEQIMIAATKLTDANGLRVLAATDASGRSAAHIALMAVTNSLIAPVLPSDTVELTGFGALS